MNVGEMQRKLSEKAVSLPNHKFGNLYNLLYDQIWLRLAHDYVAKNAGSKTAGCDGITMKIYDLDLEVNLEKLTKELNFLELK